MEELFKQMEKLNIQPAIGLRQQGKFELVESMIRDGKSWDEIGKAIGWVGDAVKEWYEFETEDYECEICECRITKKQADKTYEKCTSFFCGDCYREYKKAIQELKNNA